MNHCSYCLRFDLQIILKAYSIRHESNKAANCKSFPKFIKNFACFVTNSSILKSYLLFFYLALSYHIISIRHNYFHHTNLAISGVIYLCWEIINVDVFTAHKFFVESS